jgi:hypothetical protein
LVAVGAVAACGNRELLEAFEIVGELAALVGGPGVGTGTPGVGEHLAVADQHGFAGVAAGALVGPLIKTLLVEPFLLGRYIC